MNRKKGFTLIEVMCVLVLLALLALLVGRRVVGSLNQAKKDISENQEKSILNAAEKWAINNSEKFDEDDSKLVEVGLDVVFLVDASGGMRVDPMPTGSKNISKSMALLTATKELVGILKEANPKNRVGFVGFGGTGNSTSFGRDINIDTVPLMSVDTMKITANTEVSNGLTRGLSFDVSGEKSGEVSFYKGTNTIQGIYYAAQMLINSSKEETRIPVIIMLTDGEPSVGKTGQMDILNFNHLDGTDWGPGGTTWCLGGSTWNLPKTYKINAADNESYWAQSFCSSTLNNKVTRELKGKSVAYINQQSAGMIWNTIAKAAAAKKEISIAYNNSEVFFYTIGIGLKSDLGKFVVDPSSDNLDSMSSTSATRCEKITKIGGVCSSDNNYNNNTNKDYKYYDHLWHVEIEEELYNLITSRNNPDSKYYSIYSKYSYPDIEDYNYPTMAFADENMNEEELLYIFKNEISKQIIDATKVSNVCVTLQELLEQGYLTNKVAKEFDNLEEEYVLIRANEATHQYSYNYATTQSQRETCQAYFNSTKKS